MNYFYVDATGKRQGPITGAQLQALATRGIITPETVLETSNGHRGLASQIPGLTFPNQTTPSAVPMPERVDTQGGSIFSWLSDMSFQDIRLPIINLWFCKIVYVIGWIVSVLVTLGWLLGILAVGISGTPVVLIFLPLPFFGFIFLIACFRVLCEWQIIILDWITETTKAARLYREEKSKQGR
jgi:hypothetical protein